jgi:hypothetical protein
MAHARPFLDRIGRRSRGIDRVARRGQRPIDAAHHAH